MFIDLMKKRRSVRAFTEEALSDEETRAIMQAALLSPSSRNIRPWEVVFVTHRPTLKILAGAKHGAEFLSGAATGIVILGEPEKSDVWIEDCSIVASNILLAAADIGLGACWIQIRNRSLPSTGTAADGFVRETLGIPARFSVEAIVALGHPAEARPPLPDADTETEKVHYNRYTDTGDRPEQAGTEVTPTR